MINKKSIVKLVGTAVLAIAVLFGNVNVNAASSMKYNAYVSGSTGHATITNTSGGTRYYTNGIYKTSSSGATSGGSCLKGSSGGLGDNKSNTISTSVSDCAHAYARGSIYKTADYASGVKTASAVILK